MDFNRREFVGHLSKTAVLISLAGTSLELSGCNLISDIEDWVPVAEASVNSLEAILTTNGVNIGPVQMILNDIQAGLAAVLGAAQEYASTTPAPVGALDKVKAAFAAVVDNFGKFLAQLNLPGGGLLNLISALVGLILSTIAGFVNKLPSTPAKTAVASFTVRGMAMPVVPKSRSRREYKKSWNGLCSDFAKVGGNCPAAAYQHISFFEHF